MTEIFQEVVGNKNVKTEREREREEARRDD